MPSPVFPTAYQVEVRGLLFGQQVENVWHVQGTNPFASAEAANVAGIFQTGYAAIMAALSQDFTISEIYIHNLNGTASGEFTLAISPAQAGGQAQDAEPGNVAYCVSLRTALAGRRTRGRKYFPGLAVGDVTGNTWLAARRDTLLTAVNNLIDNLATAGNPMCIFSRTGLTLVPVTTAVAVDLVIDSQRRRLTGRGR